MMVRVKASAQERQAAADVAKMFSGNLSESDVRNIIKARAQSAEYEEHFMDILQADDCVEALSNDAVLMSLAGSESPSSRRWLNGSGIWSSKLAIAASLALAVIVGFWAHSQLQPGTAQDGILRYVTKIGEQKSVTLEDGSVITLNTGSQILVDMQDDNRLVTLDRGEVYFDVVSDPHRPFSVDLDGRVVTVLGTEFNIAKTVEGFTLAVTEGMVSLHGENEIASRVASKASADHGERVTLGSSDQWRFEAGMVAEFDVQMQELTAYKAADIDHFSSWTSGILRFENALFSEVVLNLNRYSVKKILVHDTDLLNMRVSASIKADDIGGGLSALEHALPIKVIHQFDQILIVSPR